MKILKELHYHSQQIKDFIVLASKTQKKEGRPKKECQSGR
jgi:hypothetical protein